MRFLPQKERRNTYKPFPVGLTSTYASQEYWPTTLYVGGHMSDLVMAEIIVWVAGAVK